ncbi:MAG TPA: GNAT family N-acetyltransferase [Chitinophagaceae bacterium]|nr:GNAT family N-acetyltransferase [Chitinophagaceae bacterium]
MNDPFNIRYLLHSEIDKSKWDSCIEHAKNGLVYAFSFYLETMSKNWDALVLNEYEAVMPLTWNKKYGIYYLYQPFLAAQSGIFGNNITAALLEQFLKAIPQKFQYWDICLNQENVFPIKHFPLFQRSNFVLALNKTYAELYNGYNENIRRNVKKSEQAGCVVQKNFQVEKVIELASEQMKQFAHNSEDGLERFHQLYPLLHQKGIATTYGVFLKQQLMASCVILYSHHRIYYVLVGNHPDGKTIGASHAVIDAIIKDHAGKNLLLDFEGSDIPSLAFFYSSFGSVEEKYAAIRLNRLPFYLKWMKR